jgi:hypothetical protein
MNSKRAGPWRLRRFTLQTEPDYGCIPTRSDWRTPKRRKRRGPSVGSWSQGTWLFANSRLSMNPGSSECQFAHFFCLRGSLCPKAPAPRGKELPMNRWGGLPACRFMVRQGTCAAREGTSHEPPIFLTRVGRVSAWLFPMHQGVAQCGFVKLQAQPSGLHGRSGGVRNWLRYCQ